jgi:hypothetical protein
VRRKYCAKIEPCFNLGVNKCRATEFCTVVPYIFSIITAVEGPPLKKEYGSQLLVGGFMLELRLTCRSESHNYNIQSVHFQFLFNRSE